MPITQISTNEIGSIQRNDIDITTAGQALITKVLAGTNISLSQTGTDSGTGDVTLNVTGVLKSATSITGAGSAQILTGTLTTSANGDVQSALYINPTVDNSGAFTSTQAFGLRSSLPILVENNKFFTSTNAAGTTYITLAGIDTSGRGQISAGGVNTNVNGVEVNLNVTTGGARVSVSTATMFKVWPTTGNVTLQNGGTHVDSGWRLDVVGVGRIATLGVAVTTFTAANTLADTANTFQVFTGTTAITLTLPAISAANTGKMFMIKNRGTATLTVASAVASTLYTTAAASTTTVAAGAAITLICDGTYWTLN